MGFKVSIAINTYLTNRDSITPNKSYEDYNTLSTGTTQSTSKERIAKYE